MVFSCSQGPPPNHPQIRLQFFSRVHQRYKDSGELWGCSRSGSPLWALLSDLGTFPSLNFGLRSSRTPNYGWLNDWFHKIIAAENPGAKNALIKWGYFPKGKGIIPYQDPTESQLMTQYNVVKSPLFTQKSDIIITSHISHIIPLLQYPILSQYRIARWNLYTTLDISTIVGLVITLVVVTIDQLSQVGGITNWSNIPYIPRFSMMSHYIPLYPIISHYIPPMATTSLHSHLKAIIYCSYVVSVYEYIHCTKLLSI